MTLSQMIIGWFYYGIFYMGLSILATHIINKVTKKWYLSPLIINAISIIVLFIGRAINIIPDSEFTFAVYFIYMPIVAASFSFNGIRELIILKRNK